MTAFMPTATRLLRLIQMRKFALDIDAHQIAGAGEESYEVRSRRPLRLPLLGDAERNCDADSDS